MEKEPEPKTKNLEEEKKKAISTSANWERGKGGRIISEKANFSVGFCRVLRKWRRDNEPDTTYQTKRTSGNVFC